MIVESKFPSPLVEALPVRMGIIIPAELYNYIYQEEIRDESLWTIALGDANVAMLNPLYSKMFRETRKVNAVPTDESLDGVLKTTLEKFEFDVPVNEKNKFVEVWIQYQLTLFEPNGNQVVVWPVSPVAHGATLPRRVALHVDPAEPPASSSAESRDSRACNRSSSG